MLASAYTVVRCLGAHTIKEVRATITLSLRTLVTYTMALVRALGLREVGRLEHLATVRGLRDFWSALGCFVQVYESLIDTLRIFIALCLEDL